jgi:predicted dehydrogenase
MVGHIERFNPAVLALKRRLADGQLGRVFQMHARRLGPFPQRIRDVGVVVDLATHDLDIMRYLSCSEATAVYAETKCEVNTANEDLLDGIVRFHDGMLGLLEINWLTPTKIRELCITGERGMFRVDYLTQDLYFFENAQIGDGDWQPLSVLRGGVKEGTMTRFALDKKEPLRSELETFVSAATGQDPGVVTGQDGLEALRLALALIESAGIHQVVEVSRLTELASV